ncbi:SHOCT domain-containing protein [Kineosporia sp. A_224]|uniref:SHOCT domain-containing protein n=1 Tax=Kineosporia sp. A_224 TaxID=1962180 RepID=UPI0018E9C394|nr:SHOCT domain-containing protein [Kineosporia sp. A_224]
MRLAELLWSLLVIFFMISYLMLFFSVVVDMFRDPGSSGGTKALWVLAFLVLPVISMVVYLVVNGAGMARRNAAARSGPVDEIDRAQALLAAGTLTPEEFASLKAKILDTEQVRSSPA